MIKELSEALRNLLTQRNPAGIPELGEIEVLFNRPAESFQPKKPTINLFLYDLRENLDLRRNEPEIERRNGQVITHRPPLFVACSYLVTAWVGQSQTETEILQEQDLLSRALQIFARHPTIPDDVLPVPLQKSIPPWEMVTLLPDTQKNLSEFWSSIGNKLRPSFNATVTLPMPVFAEVTSSMVTTATVKFGELTTTEEGKLIIKSETLQEFFHIRGQVVGADDKPREGSIATLIEPTLTTKTDDNGQFRFTDLPAGTYTLRVQSGATSQNFNLTVPALPNSNYNVKLT
jgi:Pvc16 N-terminal domain/Carboxypeptidase regulatory-like domain